MRSEYARSKGELSLASLLSSFAPPVAVYLLLTGATWQGFILITYGVLVIGLMDNLLRPFLIGAESNLPDYVVLISTLGGISIFGLNGFVIGPVIAAMFIVAWDIFVRQT
jgi:predicted PurR-regulated permease PerM